jgi:hypothetical protein
LAAVKTTTKFIATPRGSASAARLRYVSDCKPGIQRKRRGSGFVYIDDTGKQVNADEHTRIEAIRIPPAWTDVWICPYPNGHILATGRDERGRKQYRYHPDCNVTRSESNFTAFRNLANASPPSVKSPTSICASTTRCTKKCWRWWFACWKPRSSAVDKRCHRVQDRSSEKNRSKTDMRRISLLLFVITSLACNLTTTPPSASPTYTPPPADLENPPATITLISDAVQPTLLPLPGLPVIAATSVPIIGARCQVYTTYSGARADNKLSMRSEPNLTAPQVFRVPNNVEVLLVPGSHEVEAEGYHWLNMIYVETPQMRYQGWIARDSFELNGVRDTSIATLKPTGAQADC